MRQLGIDLGGTKIEAAALSPAGVILARHRVPTPRDDYQGTLLAIVGLVERLEAHIGHAMSVGVGRLAASAAWGWPPATPGK